MNTGQSPISGKKHILFVEDDEVFRDSLAAVLRGAGYEVTAVPDYRLALETLEAGTAIDLMLADIVMPQRVNGLALGRMARLRRSDIKIVYITGYDIPGLDGEALGPIIRKPVNEEELLVEIAGLL